MIHVAAHIAPMVVAGLLVAATAAAQPAGVDAWLEAARRHAPGELDEPVVTLSRWSRDATFGAIDRATGGSADVAILARALVLHTDIAILERAGGRRATGGGRSVTLLDAESIGSLRRSFQWEAGQRLATALAKKPQGSPVARAWYRAVAALFQQWGDLGAARAHLDLAADLFPDDPVLTLYRGTLHQAHADPRVQVFMARARRAPGRAGEATGGVYRDALGNLRDLGVAGSEKSTTMPLSLVIKETGVELDFADGALRRALELDPSLVEARIRLAHVLGSRGKAREAVDLAREALAKPLPPFLEYYGAMVLGLNESRLGRAAASQAAFERAAALFPHAQAARVASSSADLAAGRAGDAVASLLAAIGPDAPADRNDPWAWYMRLHEPTATGQITALRASLR